MLSRCHARENFLCDHSIKFPNKKKNTITAHIGILKEKKRTIKRQPTIQTIIDKIIINKCKIFYRNKIGIFAIIVIKIYGLMQMEILFVKA